MKYRIGIDVGGTNTDAVLMDLDDRVVEQTKEPTTLDVMQGIERAIATLLSGSGVKGSEIRQAMLGTTHCTNAIVERRNLNSVAHFRLALPATGSIRPLRTMPEDLRAIFSEHVYVVPGGFDYDGSVLQSPDWEALRSTLEGLRNRVEAVSVCGVFSPVSGGQEEAFAALAREVLGADFPVSMSYQLGTVGLLERENAAILNAALFRTARQTANAFVEALKRHGVDANVYFGQNDGTLMTRSHALAFPILTIASGPTNSIRGASYLAKLEEALVVDVGGTTTDVGVLSGGFPRESSLAVEIGGVRTNFRMPDIASIGLGGGTVVRVGADGSTVIGPDSVGYRLVEEALVFGGNTLTLTDIAVAKGLANIGRAENVAHLDRALVDDVYDRYVAMVEQIIDRMKTSAEPMPVVLVGGGAILLPDTLKGAARIIKPANFGVANAIGVAIAQASGEVELIVALDRKSLNAGIDEAINQAIVRAIAAGARAATVKVVDVDTLPLAYLPGNATRIRVKAAGSLDSQAA